MTDPEVNLTVHQLHSQGGGISCFGFSWPDSIQPLYRGSHGARSERPQDQGGAKGQNALARAQQCREAEWEWSRVSAGATNLHQKHCHCCSGGAPDGFVFRSLQYIRFSGDPTQVSDLEEAQFSKCLQTKSFLCWHSRKQ